MLLINFASMRALCLSSSPRLKRSHLHSNCSFQPAVVLFLAQKFADEPRKSEPVSRSLLIMYLFFSGFREQISTIRTQRRALNTARLIEKFEVCLNAIPFRIRQDMFGVVDLIIFLVIWPRRTITHFVSVRSDRFPEISCSSN